MSLNLISLDITVEQQTAALAALAQLEAALPGLISLEPGERRKLLWMGDKSEVFCRTTVRVLGDNPQIVPPSLDVAGAQADLVALDRLRPVFERLGRLHSRLDDTTSALGNDIMDVALDGYGQIKLVGDAYGLKELRKEIGGRFARPSRRPAEPSPEA
ncbi:MAG: hypothetical protein EOP91_15000 [Lysobacteraceae bacterium]|nr:MAG: hypothetical protein EOP91_15000 [Xanthomonadaceae bacterium]